MTKEERLLRQEQRERAKAIEAAAREAGRGPLDLPYLLLVLTLVGVGLIMLFSASFPSAYYEEGNPAYYLIRQGIFAILGITAMFIVGKINYERYRAVAKMLLIFSIILLVLVLIPGIGTGRLTHGAQRWIRHRLVPVPALRDRQGRHYPLFCRQHFKEKRQNGHIALKASYRMPLSSA